ncbi:LuxR family transcriptional regulator [Sphingomonas koreensis]|nr:LuxR family transcriptional regulator [Sphingomonas koreensis]
MGAPVSAGESMEAAEDGLSVLAAVKQLIEDDYRPTVLINAHHVVEFMNRAAHQILESQEGCFVERQKFVSKSARITDRFYTFIENDDPSVTAVISDNVCGPFLVFYKRRIDLLAATYWCLNFWISDGHDYDVYADFARLYGLTATEHRIVIALVKGNGVSEIAASFNNSIETIRTHIRSIYRKMNVGSREELLGIISRFRLI